MGKNVKHTNLVVYYGNFQAFCIIFTFFSKKAFHDILLTGNVSWSTRLCGILGMVLDILYMEGTRGYILNEEAFSKSAVNGYMTADCIRAAKETVVKILCIVFSRFCVSVHEGMYSVGSRVLLSCNT